ncbi:hypothetical protein O6H91_23G061600 [Diphasiastrum complanatum]|uniref:Uncharacterized protein n=1 Tax=Diphasiastrum complanatum TaxID=34168 RepID=A0ACC2ACJ9_DIPCM|nr:hypothetical protein O6H91_23G061600 [Diphasiastrum complanatum]
MACCMSSHHDADIEALPPTEQVINEERRCTDVSFLCLFAAFWVGMLAISIKAFIKGDTNRILYGLDMDGNVCGAKNSGVNGSSGPNFTDRKNLYWLDPYDFLLDEETHIYKTVCLVSCPNDTSSYVCTYRGQWETSYFSNLTGTEMTSSLIGTGPCYRVILPTFTILNKCFPIPPAELLNDAMGSNVASNSTLSTMKSILLKVSKDFNKGRLDINLYQAARQTL